MGTSSGLLRSTRNLASVSSDYRRRNEQSSLLLQKSILNPSERTRRRMSMRLSAATRQANVTGSLTKQTGWLMEPPTMINVTDFFAGGTASTLIQVVVIDLVM